jgi:hypothetical protein
MFGPDDIPWGSAPGQGPALRDAVDRETAHASGGWRRRHRTWPGLWFIGIILLVFFILIPIFVAWDFISPRSFREFAYGPHPVFIPAKDHDPHPLFVDQYPRNRDCRCSEHPPRIQGRVDLCVVIRRAGLRPPHLQSNVRIGHQ